MASLWPTIANTAFGSALVAVVPAEMLLGELGVGYLTWIEWNNLDIAGVLFAILVVGLVGFAMDALFSKLSNAILMQTKNLSEEEAFRTLRKIAMDQNRKLHLVASDLIAEYRLYG